MLLITFVLLHAATNLQVRALRKRTSNLPDDYLVVFIGERCIAT